MKKLTIFSYAVLLALLVSSCSSTKKEMNTTTSTEKPKAELIYVYDPLCGWCYGFSPVMQKIKENYAEKLNISVMSGGLAIGSNAMPARQMWGYIKGQIPRLEQMTGVQFGEKNKELMEEGSYFLNSEPPCIAQTIVKEMAPERALDFGHQMQKTFFYDGKSLNDTSTYRELVKVFNINEEAFMKKFSSAEYKDKTYAEFAEARKLGASGFPTVLLRENGKTHTLTRGYSSYEEIASQLDKKLNR